MFEVGDRVRLSDAGRIHYKDLGWFIGQEFEVIRVDVVTPRHVAVAYVNSDGDKKYVILPVGYFESPYDCPIFRSDEFDAMIEGCS